MYCCLICLCSLEFSSDLPVCLKDCGHVFHNQCITQWLHTTPHKNCPKCRRDINESSVIKLYFGKSANNDEHQELNQEISDLLLESEVCGNRIKMLMEEVDKELNTIQQNSQDIAKLSAAKKRKVVTNENEFKLKNLAILLSRTDELRRIQNYYDSLG